MVELSRDIVLNAAHCIKPHLVSCRANLGFVTTKSNESKPTHREFALSLCRMPEYLDTDNRETIYPYIAFIQLLNPVTYTEYIQPACINTKSLHWSETMCYSTGFGRTNNTIGSSPKKLIALPMKRSCGGKALHEVEQHSSKLGNSCYMSSARHNFRGNACQGVTVGGRFG